MAGARTILNAVTPTSKGLLQRFAKDQSGATAIEYGMIASLIAVACIASFTALGGSSNQGWQGVANKASNAMK